MMSARVSAISSFLTPLALIAVQASAQAQTYTRTAVSAGARVEFPALNEGGFEEPTILTSSALDAWQSWSMTPAGMNTAVGIARAGAPLIAANPPPPQGSCVAYIEGDGAMSTIVKFQPGTWRLRLQCAQRGFGSLVDTQAIRVTIGATKVLETSPVGAAFEDLATRPISIMSAVYETVTIEGLDPDGSGAIALIDEIRLEPIGSWHDSSTWGNSPPPQPADTVLIPANVQVACSGAMFAQSIQVEGELLATTANATVETTALRVNGASARFEVGHLDAPFTHSFELTLIGTPALGSNSKVLMAMGGGVIEMHGEPRNFSADSGYRRSWTRLGQDALPGQSTLVLAEPVPWRAGDRLVIAGSNWVQADQHQTTWDMSEEVTVVSVGGAGGNTVTVTPPLQHWHSGANPSTHTNGQKTWTLDTRAEVGLLTHNVRVQGDLSSDASRLGAHVMISGSGACSSSSGVGRFSSVQFERMGQESRLSRYPLHWHIALGSGNGQYARWCSINTSYNRAITLHATDGVLLEGNVAYDHVGHGFFFEEGSERFNRLYDNLALTTRRPASGMQLLPSDNENSELANRSPATYWITNPQNTLVGNVAAGGLGTGFWLIFPDSPLDVSSTLPCVSSLAPRQLPLIEFASNSCHSMGTGLDIHDSIDPATDRVVPNRRWLPNSPELQNITNFTAYGCSTGIYAGAFDPSPIDSPGLDQVRFGGAVLAHNEVNVAFAGYDVIENSWISARANLLSGPFIAAVYLFYDGPGRMFDCHVHGFHDAFNTFFNPVSAAVRHVNHRFRGTSFDNNVLPTMAYVSVNDDPSSWGAVSVFQDAGGGGLGSVIGDHPFIKSNLDFAYPNPNPLVVYPGYSYTWPRVSPLKYALLRVSHHPSYSSGGAPFNSVPTVSLTRRLLGHQDEVLLHNFTSFPWRQAPVIVNPPAQPAYVSYLAMWPSMPAQGPVTLELDDMDLDWIHAGSHLTFELPGFGALPNLQVSSYGLALTPSTPALLASETATSFAVSGNDLLVRFVSAGRKARVEVNW